MSNFIIQRNLLTRNNTLIRSYKIKYTMLKYITNLIRKNFEKLIEIFNYRYYKRQKKNIKQTRSFFLIILRRFREINSYTNDGIKILLILNYIPSNPIRYFGNDFQPRRFSTERNEERRRNLVRNR